MSETLYRKAGRRYQPIREYDPMIMDSLPEGSHLIVCKPGLQSCRYNVQPEHASLLAAFRAHRDELAQAVRDASALRPSRREHTAKSRKAWEAWSSIMGEEIFTLESASISELLDVLEKRLIEFVEIQHDTD